MQTMSHKQLAQEYNVNSMTLTRWIKRLKIPELKQNTRNRLYTPKVVQAIRKSLDEQ